jgi:hypothetical protein|tara:strand:- start:1398 stop:2237 length:840 start_codon:yes stop_codon:yes gene_type:complete
MNIIGLGAAGCNIADGFAQYPQYNVYKLDVGLTKGKGCYPVPESINVEGYESDPLNLKTFFKALKKDEEVLFIVCGAGKVSAATLKILEQIQRCKINILYVKPDRSLLSKEALLHERTAYYVLQEYARSGIFKKIYLVDNKKIEEVLDNVPVIGYYKRLNELIVDTIHMTNVFLNTKTVYNTPATALTTARVSTFGVVDIEKNEEKLFFPLDTINERCYIYAINKKQLETDGKLFTSLRERSAKMVGDETIVSVRIHSTDYTNNFGYLIANTSEIQQEI